MPKFSTKSRQLNFQPVSMMELRSAPGELLDRVAQKNEAFIVERNGTQMACLVPLSLFMPDIQPTRLKQEFESLQAKNEHYTASISEDRELSLHFHKEGPDDSVTVTITLPHGYPNSAPRIYAEPLPEDCPHRWENGALCVFGAMEIWNPGQYDVAKALTLTRRWLLHFHNWRQNGQWGRDEHE